MKIKEMHDQPKAREPEIAKERFCGYPNITFYDAYIKLGQKLVEDIMAEGFVVINVAQFLDLCRTAKDPWLWDEAKAAGVAVAIENLPCIMWDCAIERWMPPSDNPFAPKKEPSKPMEKLLASTRDDLKSKLSMTDGTCLFNME